MRNSIKTLIIALLLLNTLGGLVSAQNLSDPQDALVLDTPVPNAKLKGVTTIRWSVFDDDRADVPYEIAVADAATCGEHIGTIATGVVIGGEAQELKWKTAGPLVDKDALEDGNYCLQVCTGMLNIDQSYSACKFRNITVRNHNQDPVFETFPEDTISIGLSGTWFYQLKAIDADGDELSYRFTQAPAFMTLNRRTGYIQTNEADRVAGSYIVAVTVSDGFGGDDQISFTINAGGTVPDNNGGVETPEPVLDQPGSLEIISPTDKAVYERVDSLVAWLADDPDGIVQTNLYYIDPEGKEHQLASLPSDVETYRWDVTELKSGNYVLVVEIVDEQGNLTSERSDLFSVIGVEDEITDAIDERPLIAFTDPEAGADVLIDEFVISGEFTPGPGSDVDTKSFSLSFDEQDVTDSCLVNSLGFSCEPNFSVTTGLHKLRVEVDDGAGNKGLKEITFTIVDQPSVEQNSNNSFSLAGRELSQTAAYVVTGICGVVLLLLALPWLLLKTWNRRDQDGGSIEEYADAESIDPGEFNSYDAYYAAATGANLSNEPKAASKPKAKEKKPEKAVQQKKKTKPTKSLADEKPDAPAKVEQADYMGAPDYMAYYSTPKNLGSDSGSDAPDWLQGAADEETTS